MAEQLAAIITSGLRGDCLCHMAGKGLRKRDRLVERHRRSGPCLPLPRFLSEQRHELAFEATFELVLCFEVRIHHDVRVARVPQLLDALGCEEVLEPVLTEVVQVTVDERRCLLRHEYLSAMAGCRDAGTAMNVDAHVALVGEERRSGVQADAYADRTDESASVGSAAAASAAGAVANATKNASPWVSTSTPS